MDEIIENVRRLSRDLSPAVLEEMGLSSALRYLLEEFQEYHPHVSYQEEVDEIDAAFSQPTQIFIYRVFQESLTIYLQAQPGQPDIRDRQKAGGPGGFAIQDNGQGLRSSLSGRRQRQGPRYSRHAGTVRMIGANWRFEPRGSGTRISFTIPIEGASTDESTLSHRSG